MCSPVACSNISLTNSSIGGLSSSSGNSSPGGGAMGASSRSYSFVPDSEGEVPCAGDGDLGVDGVRGLGIRTGLGRGTVIGCLRRPSATGNKNSSLTLVTVTSSALNRFT